MNPLKNITIAIFSFFFVPIALMAQNENVQEWPKEIVSGEYIITLYQPEDASYLDNKLKSCTVINCFKFSFTKLPTVKLLVLTEKSDFNWYK